MNKGAKNAIAQIKDKNYMHIANKFGYNGELLIVGIGYDPSTKKHTCIIEKSTESYH